MARKKQPNLPNATDILSALECVSHASTMARTLLNVLPEPESKKLISKLTQFDAFDLCMNLSQSILHVNNTDHHLKWCVDHLTAVTSSALSGIEDFADYVKTLQKRAKRNHEKYRRENEDIANFNIHKGTSETIDTIKQSVRLGYQALPGIGDGNFRDHVDAELKKVNILKDRYIELQAFEAKVDAHIENINDRKEEKSDKKKDELDKDEDSKHKKQLLWTAIIGAIILPVIFFIIKYFS